MRRLPESLCFGRTVGIHRRHVVRECIAEGELGLDPVGVIVGTIVESHAAWMKMRSGLIFYL